MADAYTGEIRLFAGNYAPLNWEFCNGKILNVSQNTTLYSIIGNRYGGDGQRTFALPNLNGAAPMGQGTGPGLTPRDVGEPVGTANVTLLSTEMPAHIHVPTAVTNVGNSESPANNYWGELAPSGRPPAARPLYDATSNVTMSPLAIGVTGGSLPHNNMQPYLVLNYIICLQGVFPQRS
jgi:microcystin-dependent protein